MRAALRRLERQACPPDRLEVARVRASEARHGHGYVKHFRKPPPGLDELELDLSALDLMAVVQSGPEQHFVSCRDKRKSGPACARPASPGSEEPIFRSD